MVVTWFVILGFMALDVWIAAIHKRGEGRSFWSNAAAVAGAIVALVLFVNGRYVEGVIAAAPGIALAIWAERQAKATAAPPAPTAD